MNKTKLSVLAGCLLVLAIACGKKEETATSETTAPSTEAPAVFDPATGTATISGKVAFEGTPPLQAEIKMNADAVCISMHKDPVHAEEVLVTGGNLENVFVYVKEGLEKYSFKAPATDASIDQQGCRYQPHVQGMMVGQKLKIINNDPTLHNIHCWAEKNAQFNIGQPIKGMETEKTFSTPEVMIHFKCDVHKWMSCYVGVLPHPYFAVTGKDGAFTLKNLPPGEYVIEAWQEKLGTQTQKVKVGDKEAKEVNFSYKAS